MITYTFSELAGKPLIVDAIYEGGKAGNAGDDPLSKLVNCGNQGGFRLVGRGTPSYVILYTSFEDPDWPDFIDLRTGFFTYYGDNKKPGRLIHEARGNRILRDAFAAIHDNPPRRQDVPPFLIFVKHPTKNSSRSVRFLGLAAPGSPNLPPTDDLVAIWKSTAGSRFQNYRAVFTIFNIGEVPLQWLNELRNREYPVTYTPEVWTRWVDRGAYEPLIAPPTQEYRTVQDQLPQTGLEKQMLFTVYDYFKDQPVEFENCAAEIAKSENSRIVIEEVTRSTADGGRDAIGHLILGLDSDPVKVTFALEAKCYRPEAYQGQGGNNVGVKELARLISRLRHRQFGIFVTTSAVSRQAYKELRADGHPVIILSGVDLIRILRARGIGNVKQLNHWLQTRFPKHVPIV